ncbi:MAG TPA: SOS response-associated peptidase [Fimbriimonadaceae bacterium]|nr:SOS response-associated peptidase [Fimbriimonadaceae bacterium]
MCARFTLRLGAEAVKQLFELEETPELPERFNIAPTQDVPAVLTDKEGHRRMKMLRWGLVPYWAEDVSIGSRLINAKCETVDEKPAFRKAFAKRRCLIPTDGFYEWKEVQEGQPDLFGERPAKTKIRKQPYHITMKDGGLFAFAGIWEFWKGPDGNDVLSCSILTCEPNELVSDLHDRMPLIVAPEDFDLWMDREIQTSGPLQPILRPFPAERMAITPVNPIVGNPNNEGPECIESMSA